MKRHKKRSSFSRIPHAQRRCFQMHVAHHYLDLGYPQKKAVAAAYSEYRAGKLKGVCRLKKVS